MTRVSPAGLVGSIAWLTISTVLAASDDRPDLVVADFEGAYYRPWVSEGEAFGVGPARGEFAGQMAVEGFAGKGLVNSFRGGDDSTGILTSPPFLIERTHLNFLIGGGKFPGETCLDLLLDGAVVRSATGPNDKPGGSERLEWASWDVTDLVGKTVVLRVVDHRKGGWGHINVDQIVQSDRGRGIVTLTREIAIESKSLDLPVAERATIRRLKVSGGGLTREFDIKLAEGKPDYFCRLDLEPFAAKTVRIEARLPGDSQALDGIKPSSARSEPVSPYLEEGRPQFHFTSRRGWLNDPNGLVFFDGEYHLFYQHNPYGWDWGNMHWGHAVSPDLVHWNEQPIALYPHEYGDMAFSGSAVVDRDNTSGFGDGKTPPMVAAYTSTGRGECIIFSLDRGQTWTEFAGNPVVKHVGRDPRLLWHGPSKHWVMAVYDETDGRRDVVFYTSTDLKSWTFASRIGGFYECPDLFDLPVAGSPDQKFWVLSAADGAYLLGQFDGTTFKPEPGEKRRTWFGNFYAAQTFSDEPQGRRVQIGWAQGINFPGKPFNQQMNIPCELTLRKTDQGVRLVANPVAEVDTLRGGSHSKSVGQRQGEGDLVLKQQGLSDCFDLTLVASVAKKGEIKLTLPGAIVSYDEGRQLLECNGAVAQLEPESGQIKLRMLVDANSIEVFANEGRVAISKALTKPLSPNRGATATSSGPGDRSLMMEVYSLKSIWR